MEVAGGVWAKAWATNEPFVSKVCSELCRGRRRVWVGSGLLAQCCKRREHGAALSLDQSISSISSIHIVSIYGISQLIIIHAQGHSKVLA